MSSRLPRLSETLLIFFLCFAATIAIRFRSEAFGPTSAHWTDPIDHYKYEYVAEHPLGSFHIQPTCWRIGVPLLVRLLPFSTWKSFDLLGILFFGLTGGTIYLWLLAMPRPREQAILGVLMFYSLGPAVKMVLAGVESPDAASYFFIVLALYAIYAENDYLCAGALALGMSCKETLVAVVPLHYTLRAMRLIDSARLKRSVVVAVPAICVLVGIRILIPAWNDRDDYVKSLPAIYTVVGDGKARYDLVTAFHGVLNAYRGMSAVDRLRLFSWGSLGIQLFLPFFNWRDNRNVFVRWTPYWLLVSASLLIAVNADRRLGSLFPLLIVAGLNGLLVITKRLGVRITDWYFIFSLQFALVLLKKDVPVVPFDLQAVAFIAGLCWLFTRARNDATVPAM